MENIANKHFHFIAIGGVGMSALAKYLRERGATISGSDIQESKYTKLLNNIGVKINIGHKKEYISKDMIIIASSAIHDDNPEIQRAKELNLKIYHRSDILKMISDEFAQKSGAYFIGFSGTHGKTTTSGLCAYVLEKGGFSPSYIVGGIIPEINTNGKYNHEKYFIAELDESDGTIQKYSTDIAVINNMEEDHLDYYKNGFIDIAKTFGKYLSNNKNQKVIINNDNIGNRKFIELYKEYNYITFGLKNKSTYMAQNVQKEGLTSQFDVYKNEKYIDTFKIIIPGEHNIYNALGVIAALIELEIDIKNIKDYFSRFSGMGRRFQKVGEYNEINIYDDYAHHPSEIKTTLNSVKNSIKKTNRLVAIFQPHRYTRLQGLWNDFKTAFNCADIVYITDVYSAGEDEIPNINSKTFSKEIENKNSQYISGSIEEAAYRIYPELKKGDIVITLGAGDITKFSKALINNLEGKN